MADRAKITGIDDNGDLIKYTSADGLECYEYDAVVKYLLENYGHWKSDQFVTWYNGQTGAIIDGKFMIYVSDFDRFILGLPDADSI